MHAHTAGHLASHNLPLLGLAVLLCGLSAYTGALTFARSRAANGTQSFAWLFAGATMIAWGVWTLHFVAMLAMDPGLPVRFDPALTAWSAAIVLAMCWAGYALMRRSPTVWHMLLGGATVASGIFVMHQVGMLGYELPARVSWDLRLIGIAWVAGILLTWGATVLYRMAPGRMRIAVTPAGVILAAVAIHFISMAGMRFAPDATVPFSGAGLSRTYLAIVIALGTACIVGGTAAVVAGDVLLGRRRRREDLRVAALTERLKEAEAQAELARRAKTEFLGAMSHELRTPLNGVLGMSSVLAQTGLKPDQKQMLELICESARALETVVSDVLDLSQADSGDLKIHPAPFDPRELTEACIALFREKAFRKGLALTAEYDSALQGSYVGDARRIRQVLGNLVSNALKFTEKGGVRIVVSAQTSDAYADRAALSFAVIDTGMGVAVADQPVIFQAFRQADNSNARRHGGTGLGLAIADHLARLMGGRITVESEVGRGSVFRFQIAVGAAADDAQDADAAPAGSPDWSLASRMSVLVIDDNPADRILLRGALERMGASVTLCETLAEAEGPIASQRFDLIVYDVSLAMVDGANDLRRIRRTEAEARRAATPLLVCTARAQPHQRLDYLRAGADSVLEKPLDVERFFAAVEELCEADNTLSILNAAGETGAA